MISWPIYDSVCPILSLSRFFCHTISLSCYLFVGYCYHFLFFSTIHWCLHGTLYVNIKFPQDTRPSHISVKQIRQTLYGQIHITEIYRMAIWSELTLGHFFHLFRVTRPIQMFYPRPYFFPLFYEKQLKVAISISDAGSGHYFRVKVTKKKPTYRPSFFCQ